MGGGAVTQNHLPCCHGNGLSAIVQGLNPDKGMEGAGEDCVNRVGMGGTMAEQGKTWKKGKTQKKR